jgi:hypothetical protein
MACTVHRGVVAPLEKAGFRRGKAFVFDEFRAIAADDLELRKL